MDTEVLTVSMGGSKGDKRGYLFWGEPVSTTEVVA